MFRHILLPTDFSASSDVALDYARGVATRFGATLHLLHVIEAPIITGPLGADMLITNSGTTQRDLFHDAKARIMARVASGERAGIPTMTEIVTGPSAGAILDYARKRGIDLIVMGTHGRSGMAHLLMGSVAEKVVRRAPCPVLTVRDTAAAGSAAPRAAMFATIT